MNKKPANEVESVDSLDENGDQHSNNSVDKNSSSQEPDCHPEIQRVRSCSLANFLHYFLISQLSLITKGNEEGFY